MNKKVLFVLLAILMMAVMTVSVSADQDGLTNWCNMDQYGCWVTGEEGEQIYIMFWSEEARTYFMGPNSNAVVTDYCADCNGKLGMNNSDRGLTIDEMKAWLLDFWSNNYKKHLNSLSEDERQYMLTPEEHRARNSEWLSTASDGSIKYNYRMNQK